MSEATDTTTPAGLVRFLRGELRPRGKILTPFNLISAPIMAVGVVLIVIRFVYGLGAVTNLSQQYPWGIWVGFDVITGVAFAGGAYVLTFIVYVMRAEKYHAVVNAAVLNGMLGYVFAAGSLQLDLGRPWKIVNPIIGNSFGYNSVLFLVAWHFLLYLTAQVLEFFPVVASWLGWRRVRQLLHSMLLGVVIVGFTLSILHQSGLGALFLMAKGKLHPLWYSEFLPVNFLCSSVFAGLSMVIVEGTISHRVFAYQIDEDHHRGFDEIVFGLAKGASVAMFVYYFFQAFIFVHGKHWNLIQGFYGVWYLVEMLGFVLVPCILYANGVRRRSLLLVRVAAVMALLGVLLNRLNISLVAFNYQLPNRYWPSWMEVVITLTIVFTEIYLFRFMVHRMPVLRFSHDPAGAQPAPRTA
jgi:Ni/Fe-hydrogenase subunit HybB-like protein